MVRCEQEAATAMAINVRLRARENYRTPELEDLVIHIERPRRLSKRGRITNYYYDTVSGHTWCDEPFLRAKYAAKNTTWPWAAFETSSPATCLECLGREQL